MWKTAIVPTCCDTVHAIDSSDRCIDEASIVLPRPVASIATSARWLACDWHASLPFIYRPKCHCLLTCALAEHSQLVQLHELTLLSKPGRELDLNSGKPQKCSLA